ncbi:hypothetical protein AYL99_11765 [Fonsecaea erecta]|uniref:Copper transporter n=1 Tax=Fonsecaea erecta TaxID=1367422 RepID=A0A178Z4I6_9EURO|nr:hypothetical protein AYL99_11765 [Fonsecaea erecta]OAP54005.1 hypothetical protein AYL99_11765 [Fonsecaea erecta]
MDHQHGTNINSDWMDNPGRNDDDDSSDTLLFAILTLSISYFVLRTLGVVILVALLLFAVWIVMGKDASSPRIA